MADKYEHERLLEEFRTYRVMMSNFFMLAFMFLLVAVLLAGIAPVSLNPSAVHAAVFGSLYWLIAWLVIWFLQCRTTKKLWGNGHG